MRNVFNFFCNKIDELCNENTGKEMASYIFDTISVDPQILLLILGPLLGAALGFCITLVNTSPMILRDSCYGAFLGLLSVLAYKLFMMSLKRSSLEEDEEGEDNENLSQDMTKIKRALAQLRELDQDRERLRKPRIPEPDAPVSARTRSQTRG